MRFKEYEDHAVSTVGHSPNDWPGGLVAYYALGVAEEAGEVVGKVKKALRRKESLAHPTTETKFQLLGELGDVLWYVTAEAHALGSSLEEIAQLNMLKRDGRQERGTVVGEGDNR